MRKLLVISTIVFLLLCSALPAFIIGGDVYASDHQYTLSDSSFEYNGTPYVTNVGGTIYYDSILNVTTSYSYPWTLAGTSDIDCGLYNETVGGLSYNITIWYEDGQKTNLENFLSSFIPVWVCDAYATSLFIPKVS